MAATKNNAKKKALIRLDLGFGGLLATAVVLFCIFLWMFLMGVWAGQTVLQNRGLWKRSSVRQAMEAGSRALAPLSAITGMGAAPVDDEAEPEYEGPTFFALQTGAVDGEKEAIAAVSALRVRGYDGFYVEPAGKESRYRIFAGRYDTLERANEQADSYQKQNDAKVYIALLQEKDVVEP
ncbi:MAG: SPOR domain-containing protein [Thermodesulfobacteriota bacterium]